MTSANFYSGYVNDKPTSRVINPPGGRTNNIFGTYEQEDMTMKKKENIHPTYSSNIFAEPEQPKQTNKPDRMKSNIFGDDSTKSDMNAQNKKRTGVNPITGRPFEDEETKKEEAKKEEPQQMPVVEQTAEISPQKKGIHTSSKVLQPPGGKSHKLW